MDNKQVAIELTKIYYNEFSVSRADKLYDIYNYLLNRLNDDEFKKEE